MVWMSVMDILIPFSDKRMIFLAFLLILRFKSFGIETGIPVSQSIYSSTIKADVTGHIFCSKKAAFRPLT